MPQRPYIKHSVEQLEELVAKHRERAILGDIRDELTFRETDRARALRRDVEGLLSGQVPVPTPPGRPDSEENQLTLLDDAG